MFTTESTEHTEKDKERGSLQGLSADQGLEIGIFVPIPDLPLALLFSVPSVCSVVRI
jgi:hypothetical protein